MKKKMLISLLILFLLSNALTMRKDKSILFSTLSFTVFIIIFVKTPLVIVLKIINPYIIPVISGLFSCFFFILFKVWGDKAINLYFLINVFLYSFIISFIVALIALDGVCILEYIHPYLVALFDLNDISIAIPTYVLLADNASNTPLNPPVNNVTYSSAHLDYPWRQNLFGSMFKKSAESLYIALSIENRQAYYKK